MSNQLKEKKERYLVLRQPTYLEFMISNAYHKCMQDKQKKGVPEDEAWFSCRKWIDVNFRLRKLYEGNQPYGDRSIN